MIYLIGFSIGIIIGLVLFYIFQIGIGRDSNSYLEPFNFFTCYMKLYDIDPRFNDNYIKMDKKSIKCGPCAGGLLRIQTEPCATDANGIPLESCTPYAKLYNSQGMNLEYDKDITPNSIRKFFCV